MHPCIGNLKVLTDEAISSNIAKLQNIIFTSTNISVVRQAQMALEHYTVEQNIRLDQQLENKLKKSGKKLRDIVNIQ